LSSLRYFTIRRGKQEGAMMLGLSTSAFTTLHVIISLVGILSGVIVVMGWLKSSSSAGMTALFLATTALTSVTGFLFPFTAFGPAQVVGAISLVALAVAIAALYLFGLNGPWRWIYIVTATLALYLNCFVAVVQAFQKLPPLQPLAPTQSEPPFQIAQIIVLAIFVVLGFLAVRRFHPR
jgi:hypothetical protein